MILFSSSTAQYRYDTVWRLAVNLPETVGRANNYYKKLLVE